MMLNEWLIDLAENNYVDMIDGEVCILPIREYEDEEQVFQLGMVVQSIPIKNQQ